MHPTNIKNKVGYLGPHEKILDVGYKKHVVLQEGGDVPLWMNPQERVSTKFDHYNDMSLKDNTKSELLGKIKSTGVGMSVMKGKKVGGL